MTDDELAEITRRNTAIVQAAFDAGYEKIDPVELGLTPHPSSGVYPLNAIHLPAQTWGKK